MSSKLFSIHGRMSRSNFWFCAVAVWAIFVTLYVGIDQMLGHVITLLLYPLLFWVLLALMTKRLHDRNKRGAWIFLIALPIIGPIWLAAELGFLRGSMGDNRFGGDPSEAYADYQVVK